MKIPKEKLYNGIRITTVLFIVAGIGFYVYKAGLLKPQPSVTATFISVDTASVTVTGIQDKQPYISFNYLLKNNTDTNYTITSSDNLKKFENISSPASLLEDDSDIVVNLPIYIPAHQSVLVYITDQNFPYTSPYGSNGNQDEINTDVANDLNTNNLNLNGFTFIDTVNNLTITFPNGWKNIPPPKAISLTQYLQTAGQKIPNQSKPAVKNAVVTTSSEPSFNHDTWCQDWYGANTIWDGVTDTKTASSCICQSGYDFEGGSCVPATPTQICQYWNGANSTWDGTMNGKRVNCICISGYQENNAGTACVQSSQ